MDPPDANQKPCSGGLRAPLFPPWTIGIKERKTDDLPDMLVTMLAVRNIQTSSLAISAQHRCHQSTNSKRRMRSESLADIEYEPLIPPSTPRSRHRLSTNKEFLARAVQPPPLPPVSAQDRLGLRTEISAKLRGPEVQKFVDQAQLTHVVQLRLITDDSNHVESVSHHVFGLSEVENFEKLKNVICTNFSNQVSSMMQRGSVACVRSTTIVYTAVDGPEAGSRQVITSSNVSGRPGQDDERLYANCIAKLMARISHFTTDCCCGFCDGLKVIPEISVRLSIISPGRTCDWLHTRRGQPICFRAALAQLPEQSLVRPKDLECKISKELRAPTLVKDHDDSRQARILVNANVFRGMVTAFQENEALKKEIEALKVKTKGPSTSARKRRKTAKQACHTDSGVELSSGDDTPLAKRFRARRVNAGDVGISNKTVKH